MPALFVAGAQGTYDEKALRRQMAADGYAVILRSDATVTTADANGKAVVVISRRANSSVLGTKLRAVPVPVVTFDPENFAGMGMTGSIAGDEAEGAS